MARTRLRDLRRQPPDQADFRSPVHDARVVARVGLLLATAIGTAFVTGLLSHLHQHPVAWFPLSPSPVWGFRLSQGLHVAAGLAALPLLLAKLYAAYPALFQRPRLRGPLHVLERGSVAVLVATAIFQLVTGLLNIFQWYPWSFSFVRVHFAVAWVLVGSIVIHVAVKLPTIAAALRRPVGEEAAGEHGGPTRRGFLAGVAVTVLGLTALTVGQTVTPLSGAAVLSPRRAGVGVQGVPVNRTARSAGVLDRATDPAWRLSVRGPRGTVRLSRADLEAMPQVAVVLPIACVEGWSTTATWQGVRVVDLVAAVSDGVDADIRFVSLQEAGSYNESVLPGAYARHPDSVVALRLGGEPLDVDHGYPARLIAPNRPGVLQTKWLDRIEVVEA
ncbi:molybdopterin-dependent oxidoreductase [uncultured Cellulomonas sp.]|uniref:molybdopterin-dependent oxidoreductase n=1 Tax=uncultured Cellulomonas sp. TaxID=189682 RepID=UPI0028E46293|nr:molybdopterin-dependent oxidoreductase [uncultured Cellulomonas sp.]